MRDFILLCCILTGTLISQANDDGFNEPTTSVYNTFRNVPDNCRTKVWWFHGEGPTTREGITRDLEAFKAQGVGGVVYYDQVHGKGEGALKEMSPEWWQMLKFSAQEAKRLGLSFEINMSNGYVAGGPWITNDMAMQTVCFSELTANAGQKFINQPLPSPIADRKGKKPIFHDIAVLAWPIKKGYYETYPVPDIKTTKDTIITLISPLSNREREGITLRSISFRASGQSKGHQSIMQVPTHPQKEFSGDLFVEQPLLGELEYSDDGIIWRKAVSLRPRYRCASNLQSETQSFKAITGRYFRLNLHDWRVENCVNGLRSATSLKAQTLEITNISLSSRAATDEWEQRAAYASEYFDSCTTVNYAGAEVISPKDIIDLTQYVDQNGNITWTCPKNSDYIITRYAYRPTGGRTKHGRPEALGLECDKLNPEAAKLQWKNFPQVLIDTLSAIGCKPEGVIMDSHEAGSQNWTNNFPALFKKHNGYDITPWLPTMSGWIVSSTQDTDLFLLNLRRTISDGIAKLYFATFDSLAHDNGVILTAQASGNGQSICSDNVQAKGYVGKPQGEFWAKHRNGVYDIKEASSAAHLFGHPFGSAEAYTDANFGQSLDYLRREADMSFAMKVGEMVICASAYQPFEDQINLANGRQYCLNRKNTYWKESKPFWDYQARGNYIQRLGTAVVDILVYLGDQTPMKLMAYQLPPIPEGYDFDVCTTDGLLRAIENEQFTKPSSLNHHPSYKVLAINRNAYIPDSIKAKIDSLKAQGFPVYDCHTEDAYSHDKMAQFLAEHGITPDMGMKSKYEPTDRLWFTHHKTADADYYYIVNHSPASWNGKIDLRASHTSPLTSRLQWWDLLTGKRYSLSDSLSLEPYEAGIIVVSNESTANLEPLRVRASSKAITGPLRVRASSQARTILQINSPWHMTAGSVDIDNWQLQDWTTCAIDSLHHFSGTAIYTTTVKIKEIKKKETYFLCIPNPGQMAHVFLNGRDAGCIWTVPYRVDITPYVKKGKNNLRIEVTNTLANKLFNQTIPSGMLDPVTIIAE